MLKLLQRLFGNKKDKDAKELQPWVTKILAEYVKLPKISDDDLRAKSDDFRKRIQDHIKDISEEIAAKKEAGRNHRRSCGFGTHVRRSGEASEKAQ